MQTLLQDLRFGIRLLIKKPSSPLWQSFGVGIGASTVISVSSMACSCARCLTRTGRWVRLFEKVERQAMSSDVWKWRQQLP